MSHYIFDWKENSENMLEQRRCFTSRNQYMEQIAFLRYLIDMGTCDKKELFTIWSSLNCKIVETYKNDNEELYEKFEELYNKALKWTIVNLAPIEIYQEELDFINNMQVLSWVKQYVLTMLVIYKYYNNTWCNYTAGIKSFCFSVTHLKEERGYCASFIADCLEQYAPYAISIYDSRLGFKMNFAKKEGKVVGNIRNPSHVQELFPLLKNEKACIKCGKMWTYTSFSKKSRELCDDCYRQYRNKLKNSYKKKVRQQTAD